MMDIRTYLAQGNPLLFDGAMGTYFASRPGRAEERCERAVLTHPEEVEAIHKAYLEAGCQAIKTNTFSVGVDLADGNDTLAKEMIEKASHLAQKAAEPYDAYVFADMGPAPEGKERVPAEIYLQQAEWFLEQGVRHFLVETLPSDEGISELANYLKEQCPDAFLIVSFAVGYDGVTRTGQLGSELFRRVGELDGVHAVGFNCVSGPHHLLNYIRCLKLGNTYLSVMPNAGYPTVLGRRTVFQGQPGYFADQMAQIVLAGAGIVGGCCGTTPEHIAKTAEALKKPLAPKETVTVETRQEQLAADSTNCFWEKLACGKRVIAVELDPPMDDDGTAFL